MKKTLFILGAAAISFAATAQTTNELFQFSRQNFGISTARSAGMGGAFTSLGSDAASMSINPAGLAMYSQSEIVVSPGLKIGATNSRGFNDLKGIQINSNYRDQVRATINNFAAVFAGDGWAIGVAYNRLGDFNNASYTEGGYGMASMADIFVNQLQGTRSGTIGSGSSMSGFSHNPVMWPAILGYQTWLVNPATDDKDNTSYNLDGVLDQGDLVSSTYSTNTSGGIDEFAFSGAWNYDGILYLGATLGVQSMYRTQNTVYREFAALNDDGTPYNYGALDAMILRQNTLQEGVGVNLKIGATVRPVSWFRVGIAYHSPTWTTMREVSTMDMLTSMRAGNGYRDFDSYTPDLVQNYDMSTPSRLLAGMSFTIARRIIISADYERTWYNDMKYNTTLNTFGWRAPTDVNYIDNLPNYADYSYQNGDIDLNAMIRDNYRATNNYRIGIEARPIDQLFLRAGFGYSESPYKDPEGIQAGFDKPSNYGAYTQYSGGIGYRTRNFNIDLTYIYGTTNTLPSTYFDYITASGAEIISDYSTKQTIENHNIILSFAWRF